MSTFYAPRSVCVGVIMHWHIWSRRDTEYTVHTKYNIIYTFAGVVVVGTTERKGRIIKHCDAGWRSPNPKASQQQQAVFVGSLGSPCLAKNTHFMYICVHARNARKRTHSAPREHRQSMIDEARLRRQALRCDGNGIQQQWLKPFVVVWRATSPGISELFSGAPRQMCQCQ